MKTKILFCLLLCSCSPSIDPRVTAALEHQQYINFTISNAHNVVEARVTAIEKALGLYDASKEEKK